MPEENREWHCRTSIRDPFSLSLTYLKTVMLFYSELERWIMLSLRDLPQNRISRIRIRFGCG